METFGDISRSCASLDGSNGFSQGRTPEEKEFEKLLAHLYPDLETQVQRTVAQWNQAIRGQLRSETALGLQSEASAVNVPVKVLPGLHPLFRQAFNRFDDPQLLPLLMNRRSIEESSDTIQIIRQSLQSVRRLLPSAPVDSIELDRVSSLLQELAAALELKDLREKLRSINEDILGAYFFRRPRIEIYWMAIGIVAPLIDASVENLTFVALAHELAHGYTHLGYDIDEIQWDTEAFANTDLPIVEGIAQFYTLQVCQNLERRNPGPLSAFQNLLAIQSPAYTGFSAWTSGVGKAGEFIRMALIDTRRRCITENGEYLEYLHTAKQRFT